MYINITKMNHFHTRLHLDLQLWAYLEHEPNPMAAVYLGGGWGGGTHPPPPAPLRVATNHIHSTYGYKKIEWKYCLNRQFCLFFLLIIIFSFALRTGGGTYFPSCTHTLASSSLNSRYLIISVITNGLFSHFMAIHTYIIYIITL